LEDDKEGFKKLKEGDCSYASIARNAIISLTPASELEEDLRRQFRRIVDECLSSNPRTCVSDIRTRSYTPPASFHPQRTYGTHN